MVQVTQVKYISNYTLWLSFDDGAQGEIDLSSHLNGSMFEPLKDKNFFSKVSLAPELSTIIWPNGVDIAPEFLRNNIRFC